jgi:hypothetical protein
MSPEKESTEAIVAKLEAHWIELALWFPPNDNEGADNRVRDALIGFCLASDQATKLLERLDNTRTLQHGDGEYLEMMLAEWRMEVVNIPGSEYNQLENALLAAQHMHMLSFDIDTIGRVMDIIKASDGHLGEAMTSNN